MFFFKKKMFFGEKFKFCCVYAKSIVVSKIDQSFKKNNYTDKQFGWFVNSVVLIIKHFDFF
jgi:hypothetical protein